MYYDLPKNANAVKRNKMNEILINSVRYAVLSLILKHCMPSPRNSLLWNVMRPCSSQIWQQTYLQNKFMLYKITKYGCYSSYLAGQKHSSLYFYPCYKFMIWFSQNYIFHTNLWVHKKWLKTQYNSFWDLNVFTVFILWQPVQITLK